MIVPLPDLRHLGVEGPQVLVQQVVAVVAAKLVERLGDLALFLGDQIAPDAAVLGGNLGGDRPVGIDHIAAVQEEIRPAHAHAFVDAHAAEVRVDAVTLATGVTAPDEANVARARWCAAQMAEPGLAEHAAAGIFKARAVEDRLIRRQPAQVDAGGEVLAGIGDRRKHAPRIAETAARIPLDDQAAGAVAAAPDQRAVARHVTGLHTVKHLRAFARRGDNGGRNAQSRQGEAGADALQQLAAFLIRCGHVEVSLRVGVHPIYPPCLTVP